MSETIPGLPTAPPTTARPRDAATVILHRRGTNGLEVFWLRRGAQLKFAADFWAFPGGRVDPADAQVKVEGAEGIEAALRSAAARELFEETGVLVAAGAERLTKETLATMRKKLLEGDGSTWSTLLAAERLTLRASDFVSAGRWVTPAFLPVRFDARFFLVEAPAGAEAEIWPGEAALGGWVLPAEAIKQWEGGAVLLHPPQQHTMQVMAEFKGVEDAAAKLNAPPYAPNFVPSRVEFQRGIRTFPLETATLPPATHTNAYVVGNGELLIVDPGSPQVRQYARLLALVAGLKAEGKRPKAVVLTHHHQDHIGGAEAVKERLGVPVWAHERTADRLGFNVDRVLKDGEVITLGGVPPMKWRVLHTPGHARGHVCLVDEASKAAIVGDMVAGVGTIVIDPPEGDMTDYLEQLKRLRELPVGAIYPAHGPVIPDGPAKLGEYLRHREQREKLVLDAVKAGSGSIKQVVATAYADTPPMMHPIAERSAQAILIKLTRDGKIVRKDDRYTPV